MCVKVDLHTHSRHGSFDGRRSYDEIAAECKEKDIDVDSQIHSRIISVRGMTLGRRSTSLRPP